MKRLFPFFLSSDSEKVQKKKKNQPFFKKKRNFFKISLAIFLFVTYISYWIFILEVKHS